MSINLQIYRFKEGIAKVINEANLPSSIIQMALKETLSQIDALTAQAIQMEIREENASKEENEDGEEISKS